MPEHAQLNWKKKKRGKVMSEHAHSQCTGNWKKERVKVVFLSMLLKKHQVLFMSMLRHDFPSLFSVASVFVLEDCETIPLFFATVCIYLL